MNRPDHGRARRASRAQLVVSMAVVVTIALVPVATAYLQLGYASTSHEPGSSHADDVTRVLDRSVADASGSVDGEYPWAERSSAVDEVRLRLRPAVEGIRSIPSSQTSSVHVEYNQTDAVRLSATTCPGGRGRMFGDCMAERGVVVQERAGETVVIGVSFDIRIVEPDGSTSITYRVVLADTQVPDAAFP